MENLNNYIIILLLGFILGGWIIGSFFSNYFQRRHYASDYSLNYYQPPYRDYPPRMGMNSLLIGLLIIIAFSILMGLQRQSYRQAPTLPPPTAPIQQPISYFQLKDTFPLA